MLKNTVSYTHLDVYKRQLQEVSNIEFVNLLYKNFGRLGFKEYIENIIARSDWISEKEVTQYRIDSEKTMKYLEQLNFKWHEVDLEDVYKRQAVILGASLAGKKVMTATSGPGFSLKQELIGFAAIAEIPMVIANVQRVGPSTGQPTSPSQGDVMQARWGTHGDHPMIALSPWTVKETFDVTIKAVNYAERFRTPVIILLDEIVGHLRECVELPEIKDIEVYPRRKPTCTRAEGYQPCLLYTSKYQHLVKSINVRKNIDTFY